LPVINDVIHTPRSQQQPQHLPSFRVSVEGCTPIDETANSPILFGAFGDRIPLALFLPKTKQPAPISLGRCAVRKAVGFFVIKKSFILYHNNPILASKLSRG
jgi:hypothetical protein